MDHLSNASNVITILTPVIGVLLAGIWSFIRIPNEIGQFVEELDDTNRQLGRFRDFWQQFNSREDVDSTNKTTAAYMAARLKEIVEISDKTLVVSHSNRATSEGSTQLTNDDSPQSANENSTHRPDEEALQPTVADSTQEVDVRTWSRAWRPIRNRLRWIWWRKYMTKRLSHIKNLQNQLMLSYLQVLAEGHIAEKVSGTQSKGPELSAKEVEAAAVAAAEATAAAFAASTSSTAKKPAKTIKSPFDPTFPRRGTAGSIW